MNYKALLFLAISLSLLSAMQAFGQQRITITGTIIDSFSTPIENANIVIKNTTSGTVTDSKGAFTLRTATKYPITLQISSIGYTTTEFTIEKDNRLSGLRITITTKNELSV